MAETGAVNQHSLLGLPAELLLHVLTYLEPLDLAGTARTCRALYAHGYDDQIWQSIVNRNLPVPASEPTPLKTFRDLYVAHHPHWFLPRNRIWFSDSEPSGKLVVARYDPRRGCIEAYAVVAQRGPHTIEFWEKDRGVIIHSFNPRISLALDQPVLKLDVDSPRTNDARNNNPSDRGYAPPSCYSKEILMETFADAGLYSSYMLCRTLPEAAIGAQTRVWPPLRLPAQTRVRNDSADGYNSLGHRPTRLDEVSQHNFRLRKWVEYTGRRSGPMSFHSPNNLSAALGMNGPYFAAGLTSSERGGMSIRMPEDITTFATLPESAYMPTADKPWQGIWCGDYSGHGCEFFVILQPDKQDERPLPEGMDWLRQWFRGGRRGSSSSASSYASAQEDIDYAEAAGEHWQAASNADMTAASSSAPQTFRQLVASEVLGGFTETPVGDADAPAAHETDYKDVPSGRIEAIKLTGDPNIPRGEYTFIAPDIGHGGFMRVADEEIFRGARVVRGAGHIAGRGFQEGNVHSMSNVSKSTCTNAPKDQYTPSQLIMISHDRVAQFWEGFGHISYYQRVDLDALMKYGLA
ncbi:hypothetical protein LTR36_001225 [Oleoguttula mirabilis]|uniref:F-box domain-containing protein n=1 Tax=Oleoguttula mirabilis TaxID=1507867 RepID=A0AAV9JP93_9PEZI|nr:hypothetical protein LTR36_001225 [Oleoguttula mirabilis]